MVMLSGSIVTPDNSHEDDGDWKMQLESGAAISDAEWEQLARDRTSLPWLDQNFIKANAFSRQLVRARGMVQDIFDSEYFSTAPLKYSMEQSDPMVDSSEGLQPPRLQERTPILVTPVPCSTHWFRSILVDGQEPRSKRHRLFAEDDSSQRDRQQMLNPEDRMDEEDTDFWSAKRMHSDPCASPFLANLYYDQYRCNGPDQFVPKLKLNELVEIVGVIDDTSLDNEDIDMNFGDCDEWGLVHLPPSSRLPRVHVLWFAPADLDSLLAPEYNPLKSSEDFGSVLARAIGVNSRAGNAVWLTLHSMAERQKLHEVTHWAPVLTPKGTTLGCASLNLILPTADACSYIARQLYETLSLIVPHLQCHDITTSAAFEALIPPAKKFGRLVPTQLQYPKGATIIFNIGSLQPQLLSAGAKSRLEIIQNLVRNQQMLYTFDGGVKIAFEADVRIIVLSTDTASAILPCTFQMCLRENENAFLVHRDETEWPEMIHELRRARNELAVARSTRDNFSQGTSGPAMHNNISLPRHVLVLAQKDFVQRRELSRRQNDKMPTEEDFHRWLTMTRLLARSRHASEADLGDWTQALALCDEMMQTGSV